MLANFVPKRGQQFLLSPSRILKSLLCHILISTRCYCSLQFLPIVLIKICCLNFKLLLTVGEKYAFIPYIKVPFNVLPIFQSWLFLGSMAHTHQSCTFKTSLMVQWIRIHLPLQGTWVQSLVGEDSACHRRLKPMHHNH